MSESGTLMALFILVAVFMIPVFSCELRQNRAMLFGYWFVVVLHQAVAFANSFLFTTIGADTDAASLHRIGVELTSSENFSFAIGSEFYANMLGIVYWIFGPSHLLGQELSILAFSVSCIILMKIIRLLGLSRYGVFMLLAFGALPTMVLLGSVTLRESYQVLFFMLAVYSGMKMHMEGGINIYLVSLVMSSLIMGLFHNGLIVYAAFLIILFMVWSLRPVSRVWDIRKLRLIIVLAIPALLAGSIVLVNMQVSGLQALTALLNLDMLDAASNYRERSVTARATYGIALDLSSPFASIYSGFLLYVYYLFAPFPWKIENILDVYASLESVLRMILIYCSVRHWRRSHGVQRRLLGLMLILFFSMSFMWAMGTSNYGTAMRHHMLSWWIIVVVGLPFLITSLSRVRLNMKATRQSQFLESQKEIS